MEKMSDIQYLSKIIDKLELQLNEKEKEIEELELDLQNTNSQLADVSKRCIKAIEYIENYNIGMPYDHFVKKENLLEILKGEDKE